MDTFLKYRAFSDTVKYSGLSKAANHLGYTQSYLTHMIQELEKDYGFSLLIRNKGGIQLTENGRIILEEINELLLQQRKLLNIVADLQHFKKGALTIGTFPSVAVEWLPSVIAEFQKDYPGIHIHLVDGDYRETENRLFTNQIDVGFLTDSEKHLTKFIPLYQDEMLAVLPVDSPLAKLGEISIQNFSQIPMIYPDAGLDFDVTKIFRENHISPKIKYTVKGDDAILSMVKKGLGLAILPKLYLKSRVEGLVIRPLAPKQYRTIGISYAKDSINTRIVDIFLSYLYPEIR